MNFELKRKSTIENIFVRRCHLFSVVGSIQNKFNKSYNVVASIRGVSKSKIISKTLPPAWNFYLT